MNLELEGARVLVTGGSKGIGLACARVFAAEGARIAIASRDPANLERAAASLQSEASRSSRWRPTCATPRPRTKWRGRSKSGWEGSTCW